MSQDIINRLGGIEFDLGCECDNLGIILCTYFENHLDRPEDDPEGDHSWGVWAEDKANEYLKQLGHAIIKMKKEGHI